MIELVTRIFNEKFNEQPLIVRAPGRINIIGEHTDYNNGLVLPAAIDKTILIAVSKRTDDQICMYSESFNEYIQYSTSSIQPTKSWTTYFLGVVAQLQKKGIALQGFNIVVAGDIPPGAGLSSSAALECGCIFALNELFHLNLDKMEMVLMAQKAEHEFAGVMCGIMDQFAVMFGKKDHAIKLDCRSLAFEYIPLHLYNYQLVLFNSNVKHSLADSQYNQRRLACEQGVNWVKDFHPKVESLRDISIEMLNKYVQPKDHSVYRKCLYVVEEIRRLEEVCIDLQKGDILSVGKKMFKTHMGLSLDYEVSCSELDFLINEVTGKDIVAGARLMGGGFGGCTINLIQSDRVDEVIDDISEQYLMVMKKTLTPIRIQIENGVSLI